MKGFVVVFLVALMLGTGMPLAEAQDCSPSKISTCKIWRHNYRTAWNQYIEHLYSKCLCRSKAICERRKKAVYKRYEKYIGYWIGDGCYNCSFDG